MTWSIIALTSLGFLGYYRFGDPDKVGDATCRYIDVYHGHGTNIGMRFAFLMTFFMGTSLALLLSRIFALAAVIKAAA